MIKNEDGMEVNLEALKKHSPQPPTVPIPPPSPVTTSRRTASVRIESEESKRKREEQARLEQEKKEAEERAKKDGEERKRKEEEEAKRKEEEAKRKEEEEREKERLRKEEEEKERLRLEEEERKREEDARLEEERMKAEKEKEEQERADREAEEQRQQEARRSEEAELEAEETQDTVESPSEESREPEEGEVIENGEIVEIQVNGDFTSKPQRAPKEALRIDTSSMPPPLEIPRRRPGPLDINAAKRDLSAPPLSALATARNIERLQDIEYPEGVRSPREDLNKDAKDGKFRYLNIVRALLYRFPHLPTDTIATSLCSLCSSAKRSHLTFHHWTSWVSNPLTSQPSI